ncbi:hypothetical protein WAF17_03840 [Bernardetia sp. ABR2-2B]|uniref:hypothetical protein n=1 Tax=Bernardetia sp. ABR2-2B TaxID=3127472 RepID=UPI0030D23170
MNGKYSPQWKEMKRKFSVDMEIFSKVVDFIDLLMNKGWHRRVKAGKGVDRVQLYLGSSCISFDFGRLANSLRVKKALEKMLSDDSKSTDQKINIEKELTRVNNVLKSNIVDVRIEHEGKVFPRKGFIELRYDIYSEDLDKILNDTFPPSWA